MDACLEENCCNHVLHDLREKWKTEGSIRLYLHNKKWKQTKEKRKDECVCEWIWNIDICISRQHFIF